MERNTLGQIKFDEENRIKARKTHDDVKNKASELYQELSTKGYSVPDIAHIGLKLTHIANEKGY